MEVDLLKKKRRELSLEVELLEKKKIPCPAGDLTELGSALKVLSHRVSAENVKAHSVLASF